MPSPAPLCRSALAADPAHLDRPAVLAGPRTWTWRLIHEASIALSRRLEGVSTVCNVCSSRLGFLITTLAALRNRTLMILPPSTSQADLDAVLKANSRTAVVGDPPVWPQSLADAGPASGYVPCNPEWKAATAGDEALAWEPAWDEVAVLLHTSGSTGTPEAQPKTLRHLATGAAVLGTRLATLTDGGLATVERIVCSVPPQHMFGLECSVMLPLIHGTPVLDRRPLLPADVSAALAEAPGSAWVATPLHLRSVVQAAPPSLSCSIVIVSTMPLAPVLAHESERLVGAPVLEIYGSTETGALAMRRTARESRWLPLDGVRLDTATTGATIGHGSHFASPVTLLDELVVEEGGRFTLLGRQSDLVKIAGRRASLAGLNLLLQDLPGLDDGLFYLPDTGKATERLCLIYAGAPLDPVAARRWLRARIDPVFLPRVFIRLERLPRSESGKLPRQMLDLVYAESQSFAPPAAPAARRVESRKKQPTHS